VQFCPWKYVGNAGWIWEMPFFWVKVIKTSFAIHGLKEVPVPLLTRQGSLMSLTGGIHQVPHGPLTVDYVRVGGRRK